MKKTIVTLGVLGMLVSSAFSQGMVFFAGGASASTRISTNSVSGGGSAGLTGLTSGIYYYALFASASATTVGASTTTAINGLSAGTYAFNDAAWTLVGVGTNTALAGRFTFASQGNSSASQTALNGDGSASVVGIAGGVSAKLVALGWSANIGTTLQAVAAWYNGGAATLGWIGQSAVGTGLALGDGGLTSTSNAMGTGAGQLGGFLLGATPVPEPSTLVLAGLGGLSLLAFRRKK